MLSLIPEESRLAKLLQVDIAESESKPEFPFSDFGIIEPALEI